MNDSQLNLLENYHNPKNFGKPDFVFTHTAKLSNLSCGDEIEVWLKINKDNVVEAVAFGGEGCSIAIGTASILLDAIKGKNVSHLLSLSENYPVELIGIPLTVSRLKCALLSLESVKQALKK